MKILIYGRLQNHGLLWIKTLAEIVRKKDMGLGVARPREEGEAYRLR